MGGGAYNQSYLVNTFTKYFSILTPICRSSFINTIDRAGSFMGVAGVGLRVKYLP